MITHTEKPLLSDYKAMSDFHLRGIKAAMYRSFSIPGYRGGNLAGVVLGAGRLTNDEMHKVALTLGAPTTAFVTEASERQRRYTCRFFTPKREIDMCGHVTIALATRLARSWHLKDGMYGLQQRCRAGDLALRLKRDGRHVVVTLFQDLAKVEQKCDHVALRGVSLGLIPTDVEIPGEPTIVEGSLRHLLIQLKNPSDLAQVFPTKESLCKAGRQFGVHTVCVFSLSFPATGAVVRSRDFCAPIGVYEEAASGTTQAAVGSFLLKTNQLDIDTVKRGYIAYQGFEMGFPSRLMVSAVERQGRTRITISGTATHVRKRIHLRPIDHLSQHTRVPAPTDMTQEDTRL